MQCYETLNYVIFEKIVAKTQKDSNCLFSKNVDHNKESSTILSWYGHLSKLGAWGCFSSSVHIFMQCRGFCNCHNLKIISYFVVIYVAYMVRFYTENTLTVQTMTQIIDSFWRVVSKLKARQIHMLVKIKSYMIIFKGSN